MKNEHGKEADMSNMEESRVSDEQLKQVAGGLYGGSSGQWSSARVKAAGGLPSYSRSGGGFVRNGRFTIPYGEYITVDLSRRSGSYIIAFYNDQEAWVDARGLELI